MQCLPVSGSRSQAPSKTLQSHRTPNTKPTTECFSRTEDKAKSRLKVPVCTSRSHLATPPSSHSLDPPVSLGGGMAKKERTFSYFAAVDEDENL